MKVLVIKIAAIGDFLMATPALRALKKHPTVSEVVLLAGESIRPVVKQNRSVDRVFYLDDRTIFNGSIAAKTAEVLRISRLLRQERFDVGFNFHRDWRFNLILWLAGIRRRVGFFRPRRSWLLTDRVTIPGIRHHIFHYCGLLQPLGITCLDFSMEFILPEEIYPRMLSRFPGLGQWGRFVAVAPGGGVNVKESMDSRRWGEARFRELVRRLQERDIPVMLLGGAEDSVLSRAIAVGFPHVQDLAGKTSLLEAAAMLQKSALAVTNDAGLMHLAEGVKTRVLSIFGPTHPEEKKPLSAGSVALWRGDELECAPCYLDGSFPDCADRRCMELVSPEEVERQVVAMLATLPEGNGAERFDRRKEVP